MDLTPRGIRKHLDLNKPIYARTSAYGHFGREPDKEGGFSWEKTDLADKLKSAASTRTAPFSCVPRKCSTSRAILAPARSCSAARSPPPPVP